MTKSLTLTAILGAIFLTGLLLGMFMLAHNQEVAYAGSPSGTNFSTSKIAEQTVSVTSSSTVSLLNSDANDRTITNANVFLTGGNSTSTIYTLTCATSSSATNGLNANANTILATTFAASVTTAIYGTTTGSGSIYVATSSPGVTGTTTPQGGTPALVLNNFARVWKAGSYLNCIVGTSVGSVSNLFDASITGYVSFGYLGQ